MIYSEEINKICGLCQYAERIDGDEDNMNCAIKKASVPFTGEVCRKFKYDIFKKTVRRKKKLKTYSAADFEL
jgi:hypothetical protein